MDLVVSMRIKTEGENPTGDMIHIQNTVTFKLGQVIRNQITSDFYLPPTNNELNGNIFISMGIRPNGHIPSALNLVKGLVLEAMPPHVTVQFHLTFFGKGERPAQYNLSGLSSDISVQIIN